MHDVLLVTWTLALASLQAQESTDRVPGEPFERLSESQQKCLAALDPRLEGWTSETRADAAAARLALLARFLEQPGSGAPAGLFTESFRADGPGELVDSFTDSALRVRRGGAGEAREARGFLARLSAPLAGAREVHAKFKTIRVDATERGLETQAVLLVDARLPAGPLQVNAWWECRWEEPEGGVPVLAAVSVLEHEEVTVRAPAAPLFSDCSQAVFGRNAAWEAQLVPGLSSWRARLDTRLGVPLLGHAAGIAIGDVDGDGLEDLYLCQPGGLPNKLFLHRGDGTVVDRSAEAGVDFLDFSRSALLVDLDGDGDRDLAVNAADRLLLLANDGKARFWLQAAFATPDSTSLAAADVDLDSDLDLYVCSYASAYDHSALPEPYHDATNGQPNKLFENRGDWVFVDATAERGLDRDNRRFSFAAAFEDYDLDGDPDLYVANDFGRDNLYRNDAGVFTEVGAASGADDIAAGMGVSWGDYDGDGRFDLYVSNMFSSAGNRIAFQERFHAEASDEVRGHYRRHARGNTLYRNRGDGTFEDVTPASPLGVAMGRWAWGGMFCDLNNDGWQDLLSPNGFLTEELSDDL